MFPWPATREMTERVERLELPWNPHGYDPYGISKRELAKMFTALALLYRRWFTVSVHGIDHVPPGGRAMLVGNHSGGIAFDGMMVLASTFLEMEPPRLAQGMAEKFLNRLPFASLGTSRTGNFTGYRRTRCGCSRTSGCSWSSPRARAGPRSSTSSATRS